MDTPLKKYGLLQDCLMLAMGFFVIIGGWLLQGWEPERLMGGNDTVIQSLIYRETLQAQGDWSQNIYTPLIFGGVETHPAYGTPFLYRIFAFFSFKPAWAFNSYQVLFQLLFGFLALKLIPIKIENKNISSYLTLGAYWVILAWSPLLSWRLYYGHQTFIFGILVGLSLYVILSPGLWSRLSVLGWGVLALSLVQSLTAIGPQMTAMSLIFYFGVWVAGGQWRLYSFKSFAWVFLFLFGCALASLPSMWDPLLYHISQASPRNVQKLQIPTYFTPDFLDLLRNLFWNASVIDFRKPVFFLHEAHYPIGAFLLILLGFPKSFRGMKIWFLLYSILVFTLTYSAWSGPFRVPIRGFIPLIVFIQILFLWFLNQKLQLDSEKKLKAFGWLIAAIWIWILAISPAALREAVMWGIAVILIFDFKALRQKYASQLLLIFAALMFVSTTKNKIEFVKWEPSEMKSTPAGISRWDRSWIGFYERDKGPSTSFYYGIPAIDGYWLAPRPFQDHLSQVQGRPVEPTLVTFMGRPDMHGAEFFSETYNIHGTWLGPQDGFVGRKSELFKSVKVENNCRLHQPPTLTDLGFNSRLARIELNSEEDCLISVAMNHSTFLNAYAISKDSLRLPLDLHQQNGNPRPFLLVPSGIQEVELVAESKTSDWFRSLEYVGWMILVLCVILRRRFCKSLQVLSASSASSYSFSFMIG